MAACNLDSNFSEQLNSLEKAKVVGAGHIFFRLQSLADEVIVKFLKIEQGSKVEGVRLC